MEIVLCREHEKEEKLPQPAEIHCIVCSQISRPETKRLSDYPNAKLCADCAENTGVCAICEEPIE